MFNNKHIFWIAFVVASVLFWFGILLGTFFEQSRVNDVKNLYFDSETDIFDFQLSSQIINNLNMSCDMVAEKSVAFADRIYTEASKLEKYEDSNKITEGLVPIHKRYDLLRALLWEDLINARKKCGDRINVAVYFYEYVSPSLTTKATQGTMSNFLVDLKKKYGDNLILIPIAVDTGVDSVNSLRDFYNLKDVPSVFINEKIRLNNLNDLKDFNDSVIFKNAITLKN
jgi:hypothetical protein